MIKSRKSYRLFKPSLKWMIALWTGVRFAEDLQHSMYIYIYMYICIHIYIYIYV